MPTIIKVNKGQPADMSQDIQIGDWVELDPKIYRPEFAAGHVIEVSDEELTLAHSDKDVHNDYLYLDRPIKLRHVKHLWRQVETVETEVIDGFLEVDTVKVEWVKVY